ncbi:MAG: methyl-accepting chemotaxis protein [Methanobacteriota archaeon]
MGESDTAQNTGLVHLNELIAEAISGMQKGEFSRVATTSLPSELQKIGEGINQLIQVFIDKSAWYESILDAVPFPITVTDMNTRWTFVNKAVESMLKVQRKDLMGHLCSEWGAGICNTEKCGITRLRAGFNNTKFDQFGGHFNVDCAYVTNAHGERVGHVEVVTDITEVVKVNRYLQQEVTHTAKNLENMANGDLNLDYSVTASDEHTKGVSELFVKMNTSMKEAIDAISLMITDVQALSAAAVAGDLKTRADSSKHHGEFQKIVTGVNNTLDSVITPIEEALRVSSEYARYNFTARINPQLKHAGDWIPFKSALDNIGIQVTDAMKLIEVKVTDMTANSEQAAVSVKDMATGSSRIALMAERVSRNAAEGEEGISQILKAMDDLNITVSSVAQRAEQVSVTAGHATEISSTGMELAGKTETAMKEITISTDVVSDIVKEINDQMREIGKIVNLITDIANQTDLLALNAAIEAARAGDAGRGFAVVAAEVKSLAQDSRHSAEDIADMITTLQTKAQKANEAIMKAGKTVGEGTQALEATLQAFNEIGNTIEDISKNAMDVASASEEQAASVQEVTASIGEVSTYIKNTSEEAISAAASTEEASAATEQISHIVTNLNNLVDSVSHEVNKFKV